MGAKQHGISVVLSGLTAFAVVELRSGDEPPSVSTVQRSGSAEPSSKPHPGKTAPRTSPLAAARQYAAALDAQSSSSPTPSPLETEARDPARADALEAELHEELLRASREQTRDPDWAAPMESSLADAIGALCEDSGAALQGVECRASTCEATVTWESYGEARRGGPALVSGIVNRECSKRLTLSGDPEQAPYEATLFFDCEVA